MDQDEARAWLARWEEVDRFTIEEARALTPEDKFRQLESLVESADLFEWPSDDVDEQRVRDIWMRLHALARS